LTVFHAGTRQVVMSIFSVISSLCVFVPLL
jgi:hypothetical protein